MKNRWFSKKKAETVWGFLELVLFFKEMCPIIIINIFGRLTRVNV